MGPLTLTTERTARSERDCTRVHELHALHYLYRIKQAFSFSPLTIPLENTPHPKGEGVAFDDSRRVNAERIPTETEQ